MRQDESGSPDAALRPATKSRSVASIHGICAGGPAAVGRGGLAHRRNRDELALAAAERALRAGNQQQALLGVQQALRDNPNNPNAHFLLGYIYLSRNDLDQALQEYKRTIELRPDLADGLQPALRRLPADAIL